MIFRRHRGWTGIALFTDQRHSTTHYTIWLHLIRNPLVLPAAVASRPWAARRSRLKWPLDGRKMSVNRDMSRSCTETLIAQFETYIVYTPFFASLAASTAAKINHEPNSWWITWQWNGWLIFQMLCKIPLPSFTWFVYLSFHHMAYGSSTTSREPGGVNLLPPPEKLLWGSPKNSTERSPWIHGPIDMEVLVNQKYFACQKQWIVPSPCNSGDDYRLFYFAIVYN